MNSKISVRGCDFFIVSNGFEFVNQSCVKFYGSRLSKKQLIICCEHYISMLQTLGYSDRLKIGFNLKCFKYFELSVYLHGLISIYCAHLDMPCPRCFGLIRFSHLPHDVVKTIKDTKDIQVFLFDDICGGSQYCSVVNGRAICSPSFTVLQRLIKEQCSSLFVKYNIRFIIQNDLPF